MPVKIWYSAGRRCNCPERQCDSGGPVISKFKDSYTYLLNTGKTWTGAGIITDKGTNVTWKVNGVAGDNLA